MLKREFLVWKSFISFKSFVRIFGHFRNNDQLEEHNSTYITHFIIEPTIYCPKFPEPKNGQLECKQGRYCSVLCNVGFTPQYTPAQGYYCDQSSGRWMSFPEQDQIPWPDCVPRTELR